MLGEAQREWLLQGLSTSDALWKVWANQVQFAPLKLFGRFYSLDQWDGYPVERERILQTIHQQGVRNLVLLTGDLHAFEVNLLKRDFEHDSDERAIGVELMVGAVSASSRLELIERFLKASPAARALVYAMAREAMPDLSESESLSARLTEQILKENGRWMRRFDGWANGYATAEFTPTHMVWTAYSTGHPRQRRAKRQLLWRVRLRLNDPTVELLN